MSRFNKTTKTPRVVAPIVTQQVATGRTFNQAPGFARDVKSELFLLAVSNFVGKDTFYEKGKVRDDRFVKLIHAAVDEDPDWTMRFLGWLRGEGNMRTASIVGAVEAARAMVDRKIPGSRALISSVLQRADEPGEMLGYFTATHGRKIPKPIKRGVADAAARLYSEYSLLKYDTVSHAFRFGDVLELCHPSPATPDQGHLFRFALERRHNRVDRDTSQLPMIEANVDLRDSLAAGVTSPLFDSDKLRAAGFTWEDALSLAGSKVDKRKLWEALIPTMGFMALIRNLRNFDEAGVTDRVAQIVMDKLRDPVAVAKSRQLPLRFLSAYNAAKNLRWGYPLQQALDLSLQNVPQFAGRTLVLIDTSGSMGDKYSKDGTLTLQDAAVVFGLAVAKQCEQPTVVSFSTASKVFMVDKSVSLLKLVDQFRPYVYGGGTATEAAVRAHFKGHDRVIILTDEQADYHYRGDVVASVPKTTPVTTFNLNGYKMGHAPSGTANRVTIGGLTDNAFKLLPILEAHGRGEWPF